MINKIDFKSKLDEYIRVRELPKVIYAYLREVGFNPEAYDYLGNLNEDGKILSYEDRIVLVIREKEILLVDPIPFERGIINFTEFKMKEDVLDVIVGHISKFLG